MPAQRTGGRTLTTIHMAVVESARALCGVASSNIAETFAASSVTCKRCLKRLSQLTSPGALPSTCPECGPIGVIDEDGDCRACGLHVTPVGP
jgi:hypothetical protein